MAAVNLITLARPASDEEPLQGKLNEALVAELVGMARPGAAGLLGATLLFWMLVRPWTGRLVSGLLLVLIGITVIRLVGAVCLDRGLLRLSHMRVFCWLAAIYALTGGCLAAIILASSPHLPVISGLMLLVVMIGVNSTAMVTLGASPLVYLLYVSPGFLAWSIVAVIHPLPGFEHVLQVALAIFSIAMIATMRRVHRSLRNNVILRLQLTASLGELRDAQSRLLEASREAGRSDVATAVLHNLGNVLNSVNVSATLASDNIVKLKTSGLSKVATLLTEHRDDLATFLRDDPRGHKLPDYFAQLHAALEHNKTSAVSELQALIRNIDHIKIIVASQQSHVKPGGASETFEVRELLDDALRFSAASYAQHAIEVVRDFDALPRITLDRHKAMQIVMNLLANARDAVLANPGARRIAIHARPQDPGSVEITVEDNGCGIDPDNLDRIFRLGFTTKPDGHGLGLHYSACAARELHGSLTARSPGTGRGASFLLVLPIDAATTA